MIPVTPREAIAYLLKKTAVPRDVFEAMSAAARERAFAVAGIAKMDVIQGILDELTAAMTSGIPMEEFQENMIASLGEQWGGETPSRVNNIFRTNTIEAYNAGRHEVMTGRGALTDRPYWRFDATEDSRVSEICRACDGVVLPASHPWWNTHYPAMHYQCRSIVTPLTEDEALAHGVTMSPPAIAPLPGFGVPPSLSRTPKPSNDYDPALLLAARG
jgi:SPP1 gp7 family putative phage head morphogenesis protein